MRYLIVILLFFFSCREPAPKPVLITPAATDAIRIGINRTMAKAKCKGYTHLDGANYKVTLVEGVLTPENNVGIKAPCGAYCGTEWDLGGYIYKAGYAEIPDKIVLPYIEGREKDLELAAEYEAEHLVLYQNDQNAYSATKIHKPGTGHPIITCP